MKKLSDMKHDMFNSSMKGLLVGAICLVISFLFNREIIPHKIIADFTIVAGSVEDVLLITVKSLSIILFFTFIVLGYANTKELSGKPLSIIEILVIGAISLIQSFPNATVFWVSFAGVLLILLYLWSIQIKVETV